MLSQPLAPLGSPTPRLQERLHLSPVTPHSRHLGHRSQLPVSPAPSPPPLELQKGERISPRPYLSPQLREAENSEKRQFRSEQAAFATLLLLRERFGCRSEPPGTGHGAQRPSCILLSSKYAGQIRCRPANVLPKCGARQPDQFHPLSLHALCQQRAESQPDLTLAMFTCAHLRCMPHFTCPGSLYATHVHLHEWLILSGHVLRNHLLR